MTEYEHRLKPLARNLRSQPTDAEQKLWSHLRRDQLGVRFYRQRPQGPYILDFYAPKAGVVVELDGSRHADDPKQKHKDRQRDTWLNAQGIRVLRFDDRQALLETSAVVEVIFKAVQQATVTGIPPGPPFTKGGVTTAPNEGFLPLENERSEVSSLRPKGGQEGFSDASIRDEGTT